MARPIDCERITAQLEILEAQIRELQAIGPLGGVRIKWVKPAGTAGKRSQEKSYPRLIYAAGGSHNIKPQEVDGYQSRIAAARRLKRLVKRRDELSSKIDK
ncbi:MAG: hypothetical protein ACRCXH_13470 [Shewanella sp.]